MVLQRLSAYFAPDDLEWRPIAYSKTKDKGLAAAYITNRAIMNRLDEVCGPENWRNEFIKGPDGGVMCGLSIRVTRDDGAEWVTKWDGAENSDIEPVKGGLSNAMRRAAVQWGVGRYLYDFPDQWVALNKYGRFETTPRVPAHFLPHGSTVPADDPEELQEAMDTLLYLADKLKVRKAELSKAAAAYTGNGDVDALSLDEINTLIERMTTAAQKAEATDAV